MAAYGMRTSGGAAATHDLCPNLVSAELPGKRGRHYHTWPPLGDRDTVCVRDGCTGRGAQRGCMQHAPGLRLRPTDRPKSMDATRWLSRRGRVLDAGQQGRINGRRLRQVDTVSIVPASESDPRPYLPNADPGDDHNPFLRVRSLPEQN